MINNPRKGQWVRYLGNNGLVNSPVIGQILYIKNSMPYVRFLDGHEYGCYVSHIHSVPKREAALELAKRVMGVRDDV